jgi:hypothetical protein
MTEKKLNLLIRELNKRTNNPTELWNRNYLSTPPYKANIGHFHFSKQLGGYRLEQVTSEGFCVRDISPFRGSKQKLFSYIHALLQGMDLLNRSIYEDAKRRERQNRVDLGNGYHLKEEVQI